MLGLLKKSVLLGIGLALKTKDEVEEFARDFAKKSRMTEKEGKKFVAEMLDKYDESTEKLEKRVEKAVRDFLKKTSIVTEDDLKPIKKEIRALKKAVGENNEPA